MADREPLSVAIITLDEERNLARCLGSVAWADEIVVVDSGSTDRTAAIAAGHGARFVHHPWSGFVEQKNFAVGQCSHLWVLSLDADEWLTSAGADEVRSALAHPTADAYAFNRLSALSGGWLRRTWSPDWQTRLYRKDRGRFVGDRVHESVRMDPGSTTVRLRERLLHLTYRSLHDYVRRMNRYTDLAALSLSEKGRRVPTLRLLLSPPATFLKLYLLRGGFLDGVRGLVASAGSAFYVLLKYAKLWERSRSPEPGFLAATAPTAEDPDPAAAPSAGAHSG